MKAFTQLYLQLDSSNKSEDKAHALASYFRTATPEDAAWAIQLCRGKSFNTSIKIKELQAWCMEVSGISEWLFEASHLLVGDLSETIALLIGEAEGNFDMPLHTLIEVHILAFRNQNIEARKKTIADLWKQMDGDMRIILNKIICGSLRINIPDYVLAMALSKISDVPQPQIVWRLHSASITNAEQFLSLIQPDPAEALSTQPYPFGLAREILTYFETQGKIEDWTTEWTWGGIRAQLIYRNTVCIIWTENGEILNTCFPEIVQAVQALKDYCVLDVKILGWDDTLMPEHLLQKRLTRKSIDKKTKETVPAIAMMFDVIEFQGKDIRHLPLSDRRKILENLAVSEPLKLSPILQAKDWKEVETLHQQTRALNREGILMRKKSSQYTECNNDAWYNLKRSALRIKAVLIYAQRAQGGSAGQFTHYTFGILHHGQWVGIAKTEHGLNPLEIKEMNAYIHANKLEKFGPVVTIKPERVYEIECDAVYASNRHKLGLTVQAPRMIRFIPDARPEDADTIEHIKQML